MALVTPIINRIPAFDATQVNTITFVANSGDQIVKNEIKILLNDTTETVVYQNTVTSYALQQIIPANTLTNGIYYKIAVRTYDALNNTSNWSDYQPFYCYTTPTLNLNITDGQTINSANYNFTVIYNQIQGEKLNNIIINFYDNLDNLISSSGNLYNTNNPPLTFNYPLNGLNNNAIYKINVMATTIENTIITKNISFYVNYQSLETEGELYVTVNSCDGYINVISAPIINAGGGDVNYNPSTLNYVNNNTMIDLSSIIGKTDTTDNFSTWVKWYDFLSVSESFLLRLWFYPARTTFKILELGTVDNSNSLTITFNRGITQDYLSIRSVDGISIDKGLGIICNGNTKVFLWLKIIGSTWDVRTEILSNNTTILDWNNNENNNIKYNLSTDIIYGNEGYGTFLPNTDVYHALSGEFDSILIGNGVFDELNLSLNINLPYTTDVPEHDTSAVLFVHFNNSVQNEAIGNYTKAVLQRKDATTSTWLNISEVDISSGGTGQIIYDDYFVPNNVQQLYNLLIYTGNIPSEAYTIEVMPKWGRVFISDRTDSFKLNYAVIYSNGIQNVQNGVLMPISATYPIVIENAEGNYKSGSLQFKVLGYQFEIDKTLDRDSIVKQTNDILKFLTNKKPKCIKDYNGNIFICKVINSPQISYDANFGNGITTISFDWVEQTKYNDYIGMTDLGLIDYIV